VLEMTAKGVAMTFTCPQHPISSPYLHKSCQSSGRDEDMKCKINEDAKTYSKTFLIPQGKLPSILLLY